jgi:hypothetical protein
MRAVVVAAACCLVMSACARRPDAIQPAAVPAEAYMAMTCERLLTARMAELEKLTALSAKQSEAATADAFGVFLIGVPTASLAGQDQEGNLAVSKGTMIAIDNARAAKRCAPTS